MMTHPLTDEIIDDIQMRFGGSCPECYDDMRAAADWQLERVFKWLEDHEAEYCYVDDYGPCFLAVFLDDLKEAMRPQQQENNS